MKRNVNIMDDNKAASLPHFAYSIPFALFHRSDHIEHYDGVKWAGRLKLSIPFFFRFDDDTLQSVNLKIIA